MTMALRTEHLIQNKINFYYFQTDINNLSDAHK